MKGKLYIVATPIGNLADITFRAVETLKKVSFILCEDTRVSSVLMKKYEILTPLISYRDQNHIKMYSKIIEKLKLGLNLALISDAGTPLISDPGYKLVSELKEDGYEIIPIPGPDAVVSSLVVSGLPTDRFMFLGFLPKSDANRKKILERYKDTDSTLILYESPNRVYELLFIILDVFGDRKVCLANDITKMFEKVITMKVTEIIESVKDTKLKGEYVVLIGKE